MLEKRWLVAVAAAVCVVLGAAGGAFSADPVSDAEIVSQLNEAQVAKWEAASEAQRAEWRVRFAMREEAEGMVARTPSASRINDIGRLRYDTGAPADLISTNGGNTDQTVGNRFTATELTNTTLTMFTVTGISMYAHSGTGTNDPFDPGFSFFNPPVGTTAATIGYRGAATNFPADSFAPVGIASITVPRTFLAGMYQGTFAGSDEIGMVTDSRVANNGTSTTPLGFHAFQMDFNSGVATGYAAIAGQNAMLRVLGSQILPVELMEFTAE